MIQSNFPSISLSHAKSLTKNSNHYTPHIESTHAGLLLKFFHLHRAPLSSQHVYSILGSAESGPWGKCRHFPIFVNEQSCLFTCYKSRTEQGQMSYSLSKTNIPTNWSFSEAWQPLAHQSQHMQIITCIPKHLTPQLCNNFVEIILSTKGYLPKATNEAMFLKPV